MKPITILLVDDHKLFREGMRSILQRLGDRFRVVGEADDGCRAQALAVALKPDVILMDIQMPNCSGIQATRAIVSLLPDAKIVMLTVSDREEDLFEAIKAGAKGYVLKTAAGAKEMIEAVESVAAGQVIFTSIMATKLVSEFAAIARGDESRMPAVEAEAEPPRLTDREQQVLELVARGKSNREIGAALSIAENTVRAHLRNILEKLQVHNRVQAAAFARNR